MGDPGPLEKLEEFLNILIAPIAMLAGAAIFSWDKTKLDDIKAKFKPDEPANGMGCMQACYDVLGILYTPQVAGDIRTTVITNAYKKADELIKKYPGAFKGMVDKAMKADPNLTEAAAKKDVREQLASNENTSDHTFELMRERDMAGEKVHVANAGAEQAIRQMTGNAPGVYFYGLAVKDYHTVTMAVERGADGSQKMYWMDQHHPGARKELQPGELTGMLNAVNQQSRNNTSNIYAFKPPAGAGGKP